MLQTLKPAQEKWLLSALSILGCHEVNRAELTAHAMTRQALGYSSLLQVGERCNWYAVVVQGIVRSHGTTRDGRDFTRAFASEGQVLGLHDAIISGEPSQLAMSSVRGATVVIVPRTFLASDVVSADPQRTALHLSELAYLESTKRAHELLCFSPAQRYESFCLTHSAIVDRIPQYLIASYLGITPESLSRLLRSLPKGEANSPVPRDAPRP